MDSFRRNSLGLIEILMAFSFETLDEADDDILGVVFLKSLVFGPFRFSGSFNFEVGVARLRR